MSESAACRDIGAFERREDWQRAHEELRRLARTRAGLDFEEGRWLLAAWRSGVHARLGYGSFREYIERLFGYSARLVQEKLRVAEALEELPLLARALQTGQACWSVLRELTRVATAATQGEWLAAAAGRTVREAEHLVSGLGPGSHPGDHTDVELSRHVLRFEVSGEVLASVREALAKIRRDAGEPLDDDAALLLMARAVLEGPSDPGRSSYQVALTVCESCQRGVMNGNGEQVEVGPEVVDMAACDAQQVGRIDGVSAHVGAPLRRAVQTIPPATRRLVQRRDHGCCVVPGCRHAVHVDIHHLDTRAEGGQHDPNNLVTLCGAHHRALHRGSLTIEGRVTTGLTFRHADGTPYGNTVSAVSADAATKAFHALRGLGFGEGDVRRALAQATHVAGAEAGIEALVRHGLLSLTERYGHSRPK